MSTRRRPTCTRMEAVSSDELNVSPKCDLKCVDLCGNGAHRQESLEERRKRAAVTGTTIICASALFHSNVNGGTMPTIAPGSSTNSRRNAGASLSHATVASAGHARRRLASNSAGRGAVKPCSFHFGLMILSFSRR